MPNNCIHGGIEPRRDASLLPVVVENTDPKPFWRPGQRKHDGRRTPRVHVSFQKRAEWSKSVFGFNNRWPGRRIETRLPILDVDCRIVTYPNPDIDDPWFPDGGYHWRDLQRTERTISLVLKHLAPVNKCLLRIRGVTLRAHIAPHRVPWSRLPLGIRPDEFYDFDGKPMADPSTQFAFGASNPMHAWPGEFALAPWHNRNAVLEELLHTVHATAFSRPQHLYIENLFEERHTTDGPWPHPAEYKSSELGEFFVGLALQYLQFTRSAKETDDGHDLMKELFPKWRQLERPLSVRGWPPRSSYPALPPILLPATMLADRDLDVS